MASASYHSDRADRLGQQLAIGLCLTIGCLGVQHHQVGLELFRLCQFSILKQRHGGTLRVTGLSGFHQLSAAVFREIWL